MELNDEVYKNYLICQNIIILSVYFQCNQSHHPNEMYLCTIPKIASLLLVITIALRGFKNVKIII